MNKLYFDYCSSSPLHPYIIDSYIELTKRVYSNASSFHSMGLEANEIVEGSRKDIANLLNVEPEEVYFTSGATESNNLAILGVIRGLADKKLNPHIICTATEHSSVYNCYKKLNDEDNVELTILPVDRNGRISIKLLEKSLKPNTVLVSIMHVNNETGVIQPVEEAGKLIKKSGAYFHVDGVQGFGKIHIDLSNIDLYTLSGHKIGASKGIGLSIIKKNIKFKPLMYGGGQERGVRPGTTNIPSVLSISQASKIALQDREKRYEDLTKINKWVRTVIENIPGIIINSPELEDSSPHILNFSVPGVSSALLISFLEEKGIIASSQSACSSKSNKISRVIWEMTRDHGLSSSSVRLSFHENNTYEEIEFLVSAIRSMTDDIKNRGKFSFLY